MAAFTQAEIDKIIKGEVGILAKKLDTEFSDSVDLLDQNPQAIYVQTGGSLKVDTMGGQTIEIQGVPAHTYIDYIRIKNNTQRFINLCLKSIGIRLLLPTMIISSFV